MATRPCHLQLMLRNYIKLQKHKKTKIRRSSLFYVSLQFYLGHVRAVLGRVGTCIFRLHIGHAFENSRGCWGPVGRPKDSDSSLRGLEFAFLASLGLLLSGYCITATEKVTITDPLAARRGIQPGRPPAPVEILMRWGRGLSRAQRSI